MKEVFFVGPKMEGSSEACILGRREKWPWVVQDILQLPFQTCQKWLVKPGMWIPLWLIQNKWKPRMLSYWPNSFDCASLTLQSQIPDSENCLLVVLSSFKLGWGEKLNPKTSDCGETVTLYNPLECKILRARKVHSSGFNLVCLDLEWKWVITSLLYLTG